MRTSASSAFFRHPPRSGLEGARHVWTPVESPIRPSASAAWARTYRQDLAEEAPHPALARSAIMPRAQTEEERTSGSLSARRRPANGWRGCP